TDGSLSESSKVGMLTDGSGSATIQASNAVTATSASQSSPSSNDAGSSSTTSGIFKSMMSSPKPTFSAFPSTSGISSNPFVGLKASTPSSSPQKKNAEPAAPASGTAKDAGQPTNPFASLAGPSPTSSGSASVSSSMPLFT